MRCFKFGTWRDEKLIRNVVNEMENSYNQDISEKRSKVNVKKSRRASQPINQFWSGGNNVEKIPEEKCHQNSQHW